MFIFLTNVEANFSSDSSGELLPLPKFWAGYNSFLLMWPWVTHQLSERCSHESKSPQMSREAIPGNKEHEAGMLQSLLEKSGGKKIHRNRGIQLFLCSKMKNCGCRHFLQKILTVIIWILIKRRGIRQLWEKRGGT